MSQEALVRRLRPSHLHLTATQVVTRKHECPHSCNVSTWTKIALQIPSGVDQRGCISADCLHD